MRFWPLPGKGLVALFIVLFVLVAGGIGLYATWHSLLAGDLPAPFFRVHHIDTFSLSLGVLQITLTAMIIIIAIFAFLGFQNIKSSAIDKATSIANTVAIEKMDEQIRRWDDLRRSGGEDKPSDGATHQETESGGPRSKAVRVPEEEELADAPKD